MNPFKEMKQAGMTTREMVWETLGAISVLLLPLFLTLIAYVFIGEGL